MTNPECQYLTETGGCTNPEKANDNAVATPDILNQPLSCRRAITLRTQSLCPGYKPRQPRLSIIEQSDAPVPEMKP